LRRVLAPIRLDHVDVFPNLSLLVGEDRGNVRQLHHLYRRGIQTLRTPSLGRLLRGALLHLERLGSPPPGLMSLDAEMLLGDQGAVLVHRAWRIADLPDRRLARIGWYRPDIGAPWLDPETLDIVVPEPRLQFAPEARAEIDARWPPKAEERTFAPGRYAVHAVALVAASEEDVDSPARRLAGMASLLGPSHGAVNARTIEVMGRLQRKAEVLRELSADDRALVKVLESLT
jgi:hypothetical protein